MTLEDQKRAAIERIAYAIWRVRQGDAESDWKLAEAIWESAWKHDVSSVPISRPDGTTITVEM